MTDETDYAVSYANAVPIVPKELSATLDNKFTNEAELISCSLDLLEEAEELRDTPATRELGYTEYVSRRLGYALNDCADLAAEDQVAVADAQRVMVAALSAQAADLLNKIHAVDYRSRLVAILTSHAVRGVEVARHEINALAVYVPGSPGKIVHCLPEELPVSDVEHSDHILAVYSLADNVTRAAKSKRLSNARAIREHALREGKLANVGEAV